MDGSWWDGGKLEGRICYKGKNIRVYSGTEAQSLIEYFGFHR